MQAAQLLSYIDSNNAGVKSTEMVELLDAYKTQDLVKLEELIIKTEPGMTKYYDILLYNRNRSLVKRIKNLFPKKSMMIAVGTGHLPGENGVINLLRKAGCEAIPVENRIVKTKEI